MNEKADTPLKARRGRKPLGAEAMTPAERKRASRAKLAENPQKAEFMVTLSGDSLAFVDQLVEHNQVSRSRVIQELLDMAIARVLGTALLADKMQTDGASMDEVQKVMRQAFMPPGLAADGEKGNRE